MASECVLVVDDDREIREGLVELLEDHGCAAVGAENGLKAMEVLLTKGHTCLIFLDLSMPVLDGASVLGEMRKQKPSVRVVLTSGYESSEAPLPAGGSVRFLQKPYRADKLVEQLNALLKC